MDSLTRVRELVRSATGTAAGDVRRVAGGDVCEAWRVELADGRSAFVKTLGDTGPPNGTKGLFPTEAAGLRWLAEPGALPLPDPWGATDDVLVLPWVDAGPGGERPAAELGRGLARTHAAGAAAFGTPGPTWIGTVRFAPSSGSRWAPWFAEHRLLPLAHRETDLAMLALFGAPHEETLLAAYAEESPLADGWADRVALHQLLPLLVHAVLFGGGYGARAAAVARHYV